MAVTVLWNKRRADRRAFWFFVAALLASVLFATGLSNVWTANWLTWDALSSQPSQSMSGMAILWLLVSVVFLVFFFRRKLTTPQKMITAGVALTVFLFFPGFKILAGLPYFKDIRSPFVFYESPAMFWGACSWGLCDRRAGWREMARARPEDRGRPCCAAATRLLAVPEARERQRRSAHTLENLQATYRSLQSDKDWVKTWAFTGRYFHLLGPMWAANPRYTKLSTTGWPPSASER